MLPLYLRRKISLLQPIINLCSYVPKYIDIQELHRGRPKLGTRIKSQLPKYNKYGNSAFCEGPKF